MARLLTLTEHKEVIAHAGWSLEEVVSHSVDKELIPFTVAFMNGQQVTDLTVRVQESDSILLTVIPQGGGGGGGGKNVLGAVLTIAVMVFAVALAAPTGGLSLVGALGTTGALMLAAGVSMVGMMAISALIPPPSTNTGDIGSVSGGGSATSEPTYSLSGQSNQARKYAAVTKVYGRHKVYPSLAANPLITNLGSESRIAALYDFGLGDVEVTDLKIGDSDASSFAPQLTWHKDSLVQSTSYMARLVGYDQFAYNLQTNQNVVIRTKPKTISADVDLSFTRGLMAISSTTGAQLVQSVTIKVAWKPLGGATWNYINSSSLHGIGNKSDGVGGNIVLSSASPSPFVVVASFNFGTPGEYEIMVVRESVNSTISTIMDDMAVTMIKSYQDGNLVKLDKKHTMLEMQLIASDKISGVVQNLSGIATSRLRSTPDGVTFNKIATGNPAWVALDILTGEANPKPLADSNIDWPSFIKLANYCQNKGYSANFVIDYVTTVQELLNSVLSGCRASLMITTAGKYGVLIDEEKTIPRQLVTPSNSWGFSGTRTFIDPPHAFRVGFINPDLNWQKDERIVYADGYNETNASKFEDLGTFGITDKDQAWKYGRYMMAQGIHRSETFNVTMDVENLVCQRGDLVHVANDVVKVGGMPCRVVSVTGNNVIVNMNLSTLPTGYSVRLSDGTTRTGRVTAGVSDSEFTLDNAVGIDYGDLMVLGIMDRVVQPYLVQAIVPGADLTAEISMCKYVPEVYTADTGAIPPWNPGFGDDLINSAANLKIVDLTAIQEIYHVDRQPFNKVTLNWRVEGFGAGGTDIYYSIDGSKQILLGSTDNITEQMLIDLLKQPQFANKPVEFELIPHTKGGIQGTPAKVSITVQSDKQKPLDIEGFSVNIQDMLVEIFWDQPRDKDIDHYECRYSPDPINGSWNASQLIGILPHNITKTSAGARTGKYFLQAIDTSGNRSNIAWQRTTVEKLPNVNQVKVVNDQPLSWPGALSSVVKDAGGRIISGGNYGSVNPVGYYFYSDFVKFDDVYEVRVRSKIVGYGITADDIMARWIPLASARPLARSNSAQWNAQLQIRTSNDSIVMKDWLPTSSAKPLAATTNTWSEWRTITVSDETAKVMQFRVKMESYDLQVKVVLIDGAVEIDAADWTWRSADVSVPAIGSDILFTPPFMDVPVVAVTINGNTTIEKYEITAKTRSGFRLKLLDKSGTAVAGKCDLSALGQGRQRLTSI